jgi:hypothetical protein
MSHTFSKMGRMCPPVAFTKPKAENSLFRNRKNNERIIVSKPRIDKKMDAPPFRASMSSPRID